VNPLRRKIEQEINERGPIPFSRYMELCLYEAELGYYSRNAQQFGKAGDFYTSSDVHALFGRLLARQFDEMWRALGSPQRITLQELGPGRGLFARDVLDWSERKFPDFFRALRYLLIETSLPLRTQIENTLSRHFETGKAVLHEKAFPLCEPSKVAERRHSLTQYVSAGIEARGQQVPSGTAHAGDANLPTIIFANEFFDALPVEIISSQGSLRVDARDGHFVETWSPPSSQELEFLDRYSVHPEEGERLEVPLVAQDNMNAIAASLQRGFIVAVDYGYTREEQLAGRHRGTLKAIRQHSVSANPYEAPGEQDITTDVNFTALATAVEKLDMQTQKLITQSQFLMGIGEHNQFADAFEDCRLPQERAKVALQLKHLVTPAGMGESFHVFVASKGIEAEKAAALAGLSFGRTAQSRAFSG
jgi:SAM-dependent MidA family methyltransferase